MYTTQNPYHLTKVLEMHEHCNHCGLKYQIEPSFFYGAMYVSYGVNVALGILTFIATYPILHLSLKATFISIIAAIVLLYPVVLRWSRNIYINMFVSYDPETKK